MSHDQAHQMLAYLDVLIATTTGSWVALLIIMAKELFR